MKKMKIIRASSNVVGVGRQTRSWAGNFLVAMVLTLSGAVLALPLVYAIVNAFKPFDELFIFPPRMYVVNPTWDNFIDLMAMCSNTWVPFTKYLFNSLFTTVVTVVLTLAVCLMGAYAIEKVRMRGSRLFGTMVVYALMFSPPAAQIPIYMVVAKSGMLDTYWALIIPSLATPMYFFLLRQFISQIPEVLLESARLDGASEYRILVSLIIPTVKPALATVTVFAFIANWNNSGGSAIYITDQAMKTLPYALSTITTGGLARAGAAAAASLLITLPTILVYLLMQAQVMKTMVFAGIKG